MLSRRKLFSLIVGSIVAPKALLAVPMKMKFRQPGITAPNGCGGYQFGFTGWKEMPQVPSHIWDYPMTPEECFVASGKTEG